MMMMTTTSEEQVEGGTQIDGSPESIRVEMKNIEDVKARLAELKTQMAAVKPMVNRHQRRAADAEAKRILRKKIKERNKP